MNKVFQQKKNRNVSNLIMSLEIEVDIEIEKAILTFSQAILTEC